MGDIDLEQGKGLILDGTHERVILTGNRVKG